MERLMLKGAQVLQRQGDRWRSEAMDVLIEGGIVSALGPPGSIQEMPGTQVLHLKDRLLVPGLVNAHTHSYAAFQRGMFENLPLEQWVPLTVAARPGDPRVAYLSAALTAIDALKNGTTALMDHLPASGLEELEAAAEAYRKLGIRAVIAPAVFDRAYISTVDPGAARDLECGPTTDAAYRLTESWLLRVGQQDLVKGGVGPSAPHRCSDMLLKRLASLAQEARVPLHTHLLETLVQRRVLDALSRGAMVDHLRALGLLGPATSFAHCVWLTPREAAAMAGEGAAVVHNPFSNLYLGSGIAPIPAFVAAGLQVAIGCDGANCGGSQSVLASLKLASVLHRNDPDYRHWLDAHFWLTASTVTGAKSLGLSHYGVEVGCPADMVAIDLRRAAWAPLNEPVGQLVYHEWGAAVDKVFVDGRLVVDGGETLGLDERAIVEEACQMAEALAPKLKVRLQQAQQEVVEADAIYRRIHDIGRTS